MTVNLAPAERHYRFLCDNVEGDRPELAAFADRFRAGDCRAAALGIVRHLRERAAPNLGYSSDYVAYVRRKAGPGSCAHAAARIVELCGQGSFSSNVRGLLWYLSPETLVLAADTATYNLAAQTALAHEPGWSKGIWGESANICGLMRALWHVPECGDEFFVVFLCWLLTRLPAEWKYARDWSEPMLGCSGHNWYVHTYLGFWMAGLFFPEFEGLARFQSFFPEFAERQALLLFEKDGWSKEGSPGYHEATIETLAQMVELAALNGVAVSSEAKLRIRAAAESSYKLWAPDGENPGFGDHIRMQRGAAHTNAERNDLEPGTQMRVRAATFNLPELKFVAEALNPDWRPPYGMLPDQGQDLWQAYQKLQARAPRSLDTFLPQSAFYAMRENWTPRADYAAIVAGPLGSLVSSHKHADIFGIELYSKGRRILVDNGYGSTDEPGGGAEERRWRIGGSAHNIATVDGADVAPIHGEYRYGGTVQPVVDDWRGTREFAYFSGVHEGYRHLPEPITATRRKLFLLRGRYWILLDRFTADTRAVHEYRLHFHLNVPGELRENGRFATSGQGGNLAIVPIEGARGEGAFGHCPYPLPNYENPSQLTYGHACEGSFLFATLLVPFEGAEPAVEARLLPVEADDRIVPAHEITALEIVIDGRRDVYVDQHMEWNLPWRAGGCEGHGRLFHSRCPSLQ